MNDGCFEVQKQLEYQGYNHIKVLTRGKNIVLYSEYNDEKVNRVRFTSIAGTKYVLSMADHRGRWESTPFTGTLSELMNMVLNDFAFVLSDI